MVCMHSRGEIPPSKRATNTILTGYLPSNVRSLRPAFLVIWTFILWPDLRYHGINLITDLYVSSLGS